MGELVTVLNAAGGAFVAFAAHMLIQSSALIVLLAALDLVLRRWVKAVVRYWIWLLIPYHGKVADAQGYPVAAVADLDRHEPCRPSGGIWP
jgi:beta-lactamase regulating signal transducer with metallopeptidase domain